MENERLKELEEHIDSCGICNYCGRPNTGRSWCNKCSPGRRESSGKNEIDKFILEVQHKTKNYDDNLEWIPYNKFKNIKKIGEGGFAKIYSAIWSDEPSSRGHVKVALKKLKSPTEAFINEDPETEEFFMVLEYATNEMSTGKPPYGNVPHDEKLALAICNGLRPRVSRGTPKCYIDLVNQCLDASPGKRPSSKEILKVIRNWRFHDDHEKLSSNKEFINTDNSDADKIISRGFPSDTLHPGAIYTSRLMSFSNLPKPRNSRGIQIEDPEVSDSQLIKLHVSEDLI
ncbi:unnamed protein product [Rhizophagus irregularis]|nr:unnamed protein product [Rhizophagus irregularis]